MEILNTLLVEFLEQFLVDISGRISDNISGGINEVIHQRVLTETSDG